MSSTSSYEPLPGPELSPGSRDGRLILGLDPGSRSTGYGLVLERSGILTLIETGTIRPRGTNDLSQRLGEIFQGVSGVIQKYQPLAAAVEDIFVARNTASALKLGQARGAVLTACAQHGLPVHPYEPTLIKKSLVGVGRAGKEQVAFMVGQLLGVRPDWAKDSSDALGAAICHLNQQRLGRLQGM
ncbi:MAG: crossover junction endodeoxyribonuclease RuvC [Thermodesulfobacteriota bacterium]